MSPPEGWDDIPEDLIESAKGLRVVFMALIAAGFTVYEASQIIAAMLNNTKSD